MQFQEIADQFCWLLYQYQAKRSLAERKSLFIIFEEAQISFPQGVLTAKRLQNVVRVLTVGRNFKIRVGVITQFAAMLDKSGMRYMRERYFGWTIEPNDVSYLAKFIGDDNAESLRMLKSGEFLHSLPSGDIEKIAISPYS
jgi:DNA helicase HerA-like ATPase